MRRYGIAVLAVLIGWGLRQALTPAIGPTALPFITFFPAVACAAWYGGLCPAILAIVLAAVAANVSFIEPLGDFSWRDPAAFVAFPMASGIIVAAIEAMRRSRAEFLRTRDILSTTLASIGDGVVVTDAAGRVTFLNPEAERMTGWALAEARDRPLAEVFRIVNEETRREVENPVDKVLRSGSVVGLANHTVLIARDGTETPIADSAAPVRREEEEAIGVVLVFRDVREERRAAHEKARLAAIVDSSGDAVLSKDLDGRVRTWNAAAERIFGYRAEEIVGESILKLVPPDRREEEERLLARLREGKGTVGLQTVRLAKDGRLIDVSLTNSALRDDEGTITGASTIFHDLREIFAAQDALAREKEVLETTLASIGDAVIATDVDGRVTFLNPVAAALTGWSEEEAVGRAIQEVVQVLDESSGMAIENPALRAMAEGAVVGAASHSLLVSRSGRRVPIDDSAAPIRGARNAVLGSVLVFRDVTQRRRAERELREASRRKTEFLATLAHELRNPLAPIRNSITLLQMKGSREPELVHAREVIDRQLRLMSRLLDDLLDVNRLGRQQLEIRKERVELLEVVESAVETARPSIVEARHRFTVDLPEEPIVLDADPVRLAQVFANLLTNAAKYTDRGGRIALRAVREGTEVVVSVEDTGIGIEEEALPGLFEMFAQVPRTLSRAQGGIGIGLSLAKTLVHLHGGTISARSEGPGRGSVFTVRLPVESGATAATPPAKPEARPSAVKRRILIADDVRDNADTLAMMLRVLGHEVHTAYDGEQAFAAAAELRPEVVLLDIGMPRMNGYEACRRIRSEPWGKDMYLIAQTGWGQDDDRRVAEEAGFDRHLLKPVDSDALMAAIAEMPARER